MGFSIMNEAGWVTEIFGMVRNYLTLFPSSGCQFGTPCLYLRLGLSSESINVEGNRVEGKGSIVDRDFQLLMG